MSELLVSVRSSQEARAALAGGASVIDVKDPSRGSLGRAPDATIAAVLHLVAGRCPVTAAMGELAERFLPFAGSGLVYWKWGLAGCGKLALWPKQLAEASARFRQTDPLGQAVAVAYADWPRADAPRPEAVCAFACAHACGALLLDTWGKDGTTLLDWLTLAQIEELTRTCRAAGIRIALAGSLGARQIRLLHGTQPDWFAVRGAVCEGGRREQAIDPDAVRRLVDLIKSGNA
jgi:uncharacterized protein (UPF0264 family)